MDWMNLITGHMRELNLAVSLSAVIAGLVLYYRYSPPLFKQHTFIRWAFWLLIARWLCLAFIYAMLGGQATNERVFLAIVDLQSICDTGFAWLFVQGDEVSPKKSFIALLGIFLFMVAWNYVWYPTGTGVMPSIGQRATWVAFSDALSAFSVPMLCFAFLLRYRAFVSFLLFMVSLGYAACQRLIYANAILSTSNVASGMHTVSFYLFLLLIGKLIIGILTYSLFFAPVREFSVATTEIAPEVRAILWRSFRIGLKWFVITMPVELVLAIVAHIILKSAGAL